MQRDHGVFVGPCSDGSWQEAERKARQAQQSTRVTRLYGPSRLRPACWLVGSSIGGKQEPGLDPIFTSASESVGIHKSLWQARPDMSRQ
jgi:hypothetical protein